MKCKSRDAPGRTKVTKESDCMPFSRQSIPTLDAFARPLPLEIKTNRHLANTSVFHIRLENSETRFANSRKASRALKMRGGAEILTAETILDRRQSEKIKKHPTMAKAQRRTLETPAPEAPLAVKPDVTL